MKRIFNKLRSGCLKRSETLLFSAIPALFDAYACRLAGCWGKAPTTKKPPSPFSSICDFSQLAEWRRGAGEVVDQNSFVIVPFT